MHAECVQVQAFGTTGLFDGVPVFFDFLKEHMFSKQL